MNSLYILIPLALLFIGGALALFLWAIHNGQYDDLESPAESVLFDQPVEPLQHTGDNPPAKSAEKR